MSKAKKLVWRWRAWCPVCEVYLRADVLRPNRVDCLVCPACRNLRPALRGESEPLKGDVVATVVQWAPKPAKG